MKMRSSRVEAAIHIAQFFAGKELMSHYGNILAEYKRGEGDVYSYDGKRFHDAAHVITQADRSSEEMITTLLQRSFPLDGIHGEEGSEKQARSPYMWYIDPLDGTSNFARNIPLFGISIGCLRNNQPYLGVLYFPALDLLLGARRGKGLRVYESQGDHFSSRNYTTARVSKRPLNESLYYSGGFYKGELQLEEQVAKSVGLVKIIDASSYELAQIAMGDAELYILANVPHDVVAGIPIVEEAGGKVTDEKGNPWSLHSKNIVVSNGVIHDEVIRLLEAR